MQIQTAWKEHILLLTNVLLLPKNATKPNTADSITSFTIPRNTSMTQK